MAGKKGGKKDLQQLRQEYEEQGWTIEQTRNGHLKWYPPNSTRAYFSPSTPSAPSALANIKSGLRRHARQYAEGT